MTLEQKIQMALAPKKAQVKRKAQGKIPYDYLVPSGPYQEQWDWDAFFIGISLASEISSEAVYLKNWCLNYFHFVRKDGFTPGLLTPEGIDKRLKHIKPFLAQGCYFAGNFLQDFEWIRFHWRTLQKSVLYREKKYFDSKRGLGAWYNSMESGADNNVALLNYPVGSVFAVDLNSFLYREYIAMAKIAGKLKLAKEKKYFRAKARNIKDAILRLLWDEKDEVFYNMDRRSGQMIQRVSYSSFLPLWAQIAPYRYGRKMIQKYLLNPKKMYGKFGIRTLTADDIQYNQKNIIKPYSNWQGPVWPIANYLYVHALMNYGFLQEAKNVAEKIVRLCLADIKKSGGMHENYNADTGEPLAAPGFISWNLLVGQILQQVKTKYNPMKI